MSNAIDSSAAEVVELARAYPPAGLSEEERVLWARYPHPRSASMFEK